MPRFFVFKKMKEYIKFYHDRGLILKKDNVLFCGRAFKTNAIIKFCLKEKNPKLLKKYMILIENFLSGDIDISIKDDKLRVRKIKKAQGE